MTFRSRSCVIGRGVEMFSICSAMAFASKMPTQIGSTRCPSLSRRMTIGMFVTGHHQSLDRHFDLHGCPQTLCGPARSMRTRHGAADPSAGPGRFTTMFLLVRPESSVSRRRLAASTSTSTFCPTSRSFSAV